MKHLLLIMNGLLLIMPLYTGENPSPIYATPLTTEQLANIKAQEAESKAGAGQQRQSGKFAGKYGRKAGPKIGFSLRGVGAVEVLSAVEIFGQESSMAKTAKGVLDGAQQMPAADISFQQNEMIILKPVNPPSKGFSLHMRAPRKGKGGKHGGGYRGTRGGGKRAGGKQRGAGDGKGKIVCTGGVCRRVASK